MQYFDSQRDPVNNDIAGTYYFDSTGSTGGGVTPDATYPDLTIPSSPNFPNSTSIRYIMNLPGEPYYDEIDAGNSTFIVKNVNSSVFLTRVAYNGTLTANTYKIFPSQSNTPARLEAHVGVGSNSAGDVLAYHGRFLSSMLSSSNLNNVYRNSSGLESNTIIKNKRIDIGAWNMYFSLGGGSQAISINHGVTKSTSIIVNGIIIYGDLGTLSGARDIQINAINSTSIGLGLDTGSWFDSDFYNSTSINRGKIEISYED